MKVALVSVAGLAVFAWPFVTPDAPPQAVVLAIALGAVAVLAFIEVATRGLDSRRFALLAIIAAIDAALRLVLVTGVGGFSPIFFLILVAGYAFGPSFGFLCGATSLFASAVATGGIGPWLPYQVIACGWVGMVAGIAGSWRSSAPGIRDVAILACVGVITGFAFGALLDVWDWTTFYRGTPAFGFIPGGPPLDMLGRFGHFYVATSLVYDSFRAVGNVVVVLVLGAPMIAGLMRLRTRFTFTVARDTAA